MWKRTALITSKGTGSTGNWGDGTGGLDCAAINVSGAYGIATVNIKGGTLIAEAKSLITEAHHLYTGHQRYRRYILRPKRAEVHEAQMQM